MGIESHMYREKLVKSSSHQERKNSRGTIRITKTKLGEEIAIKLSSDPTFLGLKSYKQRISYIQDNLAPGMSKSDCEDIARWALMQNRDKSHSKN